MTQRAIPSVAFQRKRMRANHPLPARGTRRQGVSGLIAAGEPDSQPPMIPASIGSMHFGSAPRRGAFADHACNPLASRWNHAAHAVCLGVEWIINRSLQLAAAYKRERLADVSCALTSSNRRGVCAPIASYGPAECSS